MNARVAYRKLMLYQNIKRSDETRTIKRIVLQQREDGRQTTWYESVMSTCKIYRIDEKCCDTMSKSCCKKYVKKAPRECSEKRIKEVCKSMYKSRTVVNDEYKLKTYLEQTNTQEARDILMTRLHMIKLECNFRRRKENQRFEICSHDNVNTEHYFASKGLVDLQQVTNARAEDMVSNNTQKLMWASKFIKKSRNVNWTKRKRRTSLK